MTYPRAWNSTLRVRRDRPRRVRDEEPKGEGAAILHPGPFRSRVLLDLASKCPKCMWCGAPNRGQIVACHSNRLRDGKGMGLKAHDVPAFLCADCHRIVDEDGSRSIQERERMFFEAAFHTWTWLLVSGHLVVAA